MIAGENINYLPGTTVLAGGQLTGYITTNGQFCGLPASPVTVIPEAENQIFSAGLYCIRVNTGTRIETARIYKQ